MSHKATKWLSELSGDVIGNSEFRVLFHLCDCHNPANGCFPTQAYLRAVTGVSNGTLNNALGSLERKGIIARHVEFDKATHRKKPTRYTLGFEMPKEDEPSPETGVGAISKKHPVPSPKNGKSHLQPVGDKPVKEPVINLARPSVTGKFSAEIMKTATFWARSICEGRFVPVNSISETVLACMLAEKMISDDQARAGGFDVGQRLLASWGAAQERQSHLQKLELERCRTQTDGQRSRVGKC